MRKPDKYKSGDLRLYEYRHICRDLTEVSETVYMSSIDVSPHIRCNKCSRNALLFVPEPKSLAAQEPPTQEPPERKAVLFSSADVWTLALLEDACQTSIYNEVVVKWREAMTVARELAVSQTAINTAVRKKFREQHPNAWDYLCSLMPTNIYGKPKPPTLWMLRLYHHYQVVPTRLRKDRWTGEGSIEEKLSRQSREKLLRKGLANLKLRRYFDA